MLIKNQTTQYKAVAPYTVIDMRNNIYAVFATYAQAVKALESIPGSLLRYRYR